MEKEVVLPVQIADEIECREAEIAESSAEWDNVSLPPSPSCGGRQYLRYLICNAYFYCPNCSR